MRKGGREGGREGGSGGLYVPRSATVCMAKSSGELCGSNTSHSIVSLYIKPPGPRTWRRRGQRCPIIGAGGCAWGGGLEGEEEEGEEEEEEEEGEVEG